MIGPCTDTYRMGLCGRPRRRASDADDMRQRIDVAPSQSAAETTTPAALFFYHIPKTGGSTVREWLLRNAGVRTPRGAAKRLTGVVRYYESVCFVCLQFGQLLEEDEAQACPLSTMDKCRATKFPLANGGFKINSGDWRRERLAIEFHGSSDRFFVNHVLRRLEAFQRAYAATGT